ncbi:hypothetical protein RCL1_000725 [Eukaryota sp. TZLM3-RCL]
MFASDFEEIDRLGYGSQGVTSLMRDPDGNLVCGKLAFDMNIKSSPEAQMLLKDLNSPFLVRFHHCFPLKRDLLLIMEYCAGGSLHDFVVVKKNKLPNSDIWLVTTQLVFGLDYLHSRHIIHRDLKPANVVLVSHDSPLRVKICDFGIAKDLNEKSARTEKGTHLFMAPEMFTGRPYTTAVDMWSLGVLIYFLIFGNYPNHEEILSENMFKSCGEFEPLLRRLLVRDASQRVTAAQLLEDEKIVEIYQDFIQECDLKDLVLLRRDLRSLKNEIKVLNSVIQKISGENSEFVSLKCTVLALQSTVDSRFSNHSPNFIEVVESELDSLFVQKFNQNFSNFESKVLEELSTLKSTVHQQNLELSSFKTALDEQKLELSTLKSTVHQQNLELSSFKTALDEQKLELSTLKSTVHQQNLELSSFKTAVEEQNLELSTLKSTVEVLQSHQSETATVLEHQSNLIDQFKELLPFISHIKAYGESEEKRLIAEEQRKQEELVIDPLAFVCKYPSEIFSRFGNRTKFIGETKGSCLELSNDDCLVRSSQDCDDNSFIAINHPLNGRITLTLRSTDDDAWYCLYVGFFNPEECQDDDCFLQFIGVELHGDGVDFSTNGSRESNVTSKLSPSQSIIISFENNNVTYSSPHSGWSRTVDCVDGWVFGAVTGCEGESWSIE